MLVHRRRVLPVVARSEQLTERVHERAVTGTLLDDLEREVVRLSVPPVDHHLVDDPEERLVERGVQTDRALQVPHRLVPTINREEARRTHPVRAPIVRADPERRIDIREHVRHRRFVPGQELRTLDVHDRVLGIRRHRLVEQFPRFRRVLKALLDLRVLEHRDDRAFVLLVERIEVLAGALELTGPDVHVDQPEPVLVVLIDPSIDHPFERLRRVRVLVQREQQVAEELGTLEGLGVLTLHRVRGRLNREVRTTTLEHESRHRDVRGRVRVLALRFDEIGEDLTRRSEPVHVAHASLVRVPACLEPDRAERFALARDQVVDQGLRLVPTLRFDVERSERELVAHVPGVELEELLTLLDREVAPLFSALARLEGEPGRDELGVVHRVALETTRHVERIIQTTRLDQGPHVLDDARLVVGTDRERTLERLDRGIQTPDQTLLDREHPEDGRIRRPHRDRLLEQLHGAHVVVLERSDTRLVAQTTDPVRVPLRRTLREILREVDVGAPERTDKRDIDHTRIVRCERQKLRHRLVEQRLAPTGKRDIRDRDLRLHRVVLGAPDQVDQDVRRIVLQHRLLHLFELFVVRVLLDGLVHHHPSTRNITRIEQERSELAGRVGRVVERSDPPLEQIDRRREVPRGVLRTTAQLTRLEDQREHRVLDQVGVLERVDIRDPVTRRPVIRVHLERPLEVQLGGTKLLQTHLDIREHQETAHTVVVELEETLERFARRAELVELARDHRLEPHTLPAPALGLLVEPLEKPERVVHVVVRIRDPTVQKHERPVILRHQRRIRRTLRLRTLKQLVHPRRVGLFLVAETLVLIELHRRALEIRLALDVEQTPSLDRQRRDRHRDKTVVRSRGLIDPPLTTKQRRVQTQHLRIVRASIDHTLDQIVRVFEPALRVRQRLEKLEVLDHRDRDLGRIHLHQRIADRHEIGSERLEHRADRLGPRHPLVGNRSIGALDLHRDRETGQRHHRRIRVRREVLISELDRFSPRRLEGRDVVIARRLLRHVRHPTHDRRRKIRILRNDRVRRAEVLIDKLVLRFLDDPVLRRDPLPSKPAETTELGPVLVYPRNTIERAERFGRPLDQRIREPPRIPEIEHLEAGRELTLVRLHVRALHRRSVVDREEVIVPECIAIHRLGRGNPLPQRIDPLLEVDVVRGLLVDRSGIRADRLLDLARGHRRVTPRGQIRRGLEHDRVRREHRREHRDHRRDQDHHKLCIHPRCHRIRPLLSLQTRPGQHPDPGRISRGVWRRHPVCALFVL